MVQKDLRAAALFRHMGRSASRTESISARSTISSGNADATTDIGCRLCEVCNVFLESNAAKVTTGELKKKTLDSYVHAAKMMTGFFGLEFPVQDLTTKDFRRFRTHLANGRRLKSPDDYVGICRLIFKYAYDSGEIKNPIRYGQDSTASKNRSFARRNEPISRKTESACLMLLLISAGWCLTRTTMNRFALAAQQRNQRI